MLHKKVECHRTGTDDKNTRGHCDPMNPQSEVPQSALMVERVDDALILLYNLNDVQSARLSTAGVGSVMWREGWWCWSPGSKKWWTQSGQREKERASTTSCFGCTQAPNTEHTLSTGQKVTDEQTRTGDREVSGVAVRSSRFATAIFRRGLRRRVVMSRNTKTVHPKRNKSQPKTEKHNTQTHPHL